MCRRAASLSYSEISNKTNKLIVEKKGGALKMKKRERVIELESTNISYLTISGQVRLVTSGFDKTSYLFSLYYFLEFTNSAPD